MKASRLDTHILVVGYRLNRLDKHIFMAVSKPLFTEFGIHQRLESCGQFHTHFKYSGENIAHFNNNNNENSLSIVFTWSTLHNSPIYDECQTQ